MEHKIEELRKIAEELVKNYHVEDITLYIDRNVEDEPIIRIGVDL